MHFLDVMFDSATKESVACRMSISVKQDLNFPSVKGSLVTLGGVMRETREGNFSTELQLCGQLVIVSGYPAAGILTIEGALGRWSGPPSCLFSEVLGGPRKGGLWSRLRGKR